MNKCSVCDHDATDYCRICDAKLCEEHVYTHAKTGLPICLYCAMHRQC